MNKSILALVLVLLLGGGCKDHTVKTPSHLIGKDQMIDIMYDLSLLDAMKSQGNASGLQYPTTTALLKNKYGTDSLSFAENAKYYAADVDGYKKMYEAVKERLNQENQKANGGTMPATDPNQGIVK